MKIEASQRLLSQLTNQEKILHYTKMLERNKRRLLKINPKTAPYAHRRYTGRIERILQRIAVLKSRHRY